MSGVRFLQTDGTTVILNASEAAGYRIVRADMPERRWARATVTAEDVEGSVEVQSVLSSGTYALGFLITGSSASQIEDRRDSLLAAAETRSYLLEVTWNGVASTWRANRADSVTITDGNYRIAGWRPVNLSVPVQPRTVEEE